MNTNLILDNLTTMYYTKAFINTTTKILFLTLNVTIIIPNTAHNIDNNKKFHSIYELKYHTIKCHYELLDKSKYKRIQIII